MYTESDLQAEQRQRAFPHDVPMTWGFPQAINQSERYDRIRHEAAKLSAMLNQACPPSRELSLAQTNLEQVVMWANAAIVRNEQHA